jgi:PTH1 family peptidyl-tRNA hydrolase
MNDKQENVVPIKLVVALGNPGPQYQETKHNIAWLMMERLSFFDQLDWKKKFKGEYAFESFNGEKIFFLIPLTYMNRSGESVQEFLQFYKIKPQEILVVHDDLEMEFGVISFKNGGGLGGHNGLRSITSSLGTRDYKRLKLGISRPNHSDITSYVLGPFSPEQRKDLPYILEESAYLLEKSLNDGFQSMETEYRKKNLIA